MADIIDIDEKRPHKAGQAMCLDCRYEWTAVTPAGTFHMDCPKCQSKRGRWLIDADEREVDKFICTLMKENRALKQLVADLVLNAKERAEET